MANKRKRLYLAFRDGINKLTGKQPLIEEYNRAVQALFDKSDSLRGDPKQKELLEQVQQITEEQWIPQENKNVVAIDNFNPYLIKTSKAKIKSKLGMLKQLMKEYNVR